MSNFPPLRAVVLTGLVGLKSHLDDLDKADCPYDDETKNILRELLAPKVVEKIVEKEVQVGEKAGRGRPSKDIQLSQEDQQMVIDTAKGTLTDLQQMEVGSTALPTNERIQIAKTKTTLIDQLLKIIERHTTAVKMQQFQETVIGILEDYMPEENRELFLKRVDQYR